MERISIGKIFIVVLFIIAYIVGLEAFGIPFAIGISGYYPGIAMTFLVWICTFVSALLYLEATLALPDGNNLLSMSEYYLGGKISRQLIGVFFVVFVQYPFLSAYISSLGNLMQEPLSALLGFNVPPFLSAVMITAVLAIPMMIGFQSTMRMNCCLMFGFLTCVYFIAYFSAPHIKIHEYTQQYWELTFLAIPILYTAFGFAGFVPTISTYLKRNQKAIVISLVLGTFLSLIIFLIMAWVFIGLTPSNDLWFGYETGKPFEHGLALAQNIPWLSSTLLLFLFFAMTTSIISYGQVVIDLFFDRIKTPPDLRVGKKRVVIVGLTLVPPLLLSIFISSEFFDKFNNFFGFAELFLSSLPLVMVWMLRYHKPITSKPVLPGGKKMLIAIFIFYFYSFWLQGLSLFR